MNERLMQALKDAGCRPGEPWWAIAEEMGEGSRALSRDAEADLVRRISNAADAALRGVPVRMLRSLGTVAWASIVGGMLLSFGLGAWTMRGVRSEVGTLSPRVAALLRHNEGLDAALGNAQPAGDVRGRPTLILRVFAGPAPPPPLVR